ncbi:VOC family protein [Floricoccus penangensis]|uniref:VOC family protein n=1 Tax=Floricoccus penangensis TaxID=1859475 RepID=UPI00203EC6AB|nr:VOC family protein [Floricoccus penangensis]URZ88054.1 VOC family protein [Floricoccus penangensis]
MDLNQTDLIVKNVKQARESFEKILNIQADYSDDNFAQFTVGSHCLMLSTKDEVAIENFNSSIILHFKVADVDSEASRLKSSGIKILKEAHKTDWGTYSLLVEGPNGIIIDFYKI